MKSEEEQLVSQQCVHELRDNNKAKANQVMIVVMVMHMIL